LTPPTSLTELANAHARAVAYISAVQEHVETRGDVSDFWAEHFAARPTPPSFDEMLVMRRGGFTYGVGEVESRDDLEAERRWAESTYAIVVASAPEIDLALFPEPATGAPHCFDIGGVTMSGSAIINALTSHRVLRFCAEYGSDNRALRVFEIGTGYGQGPYQLFTNLEIEEYAICDLPGNMLLSSFFLQASLPDRGASFIGPGGSEHPGRGGLVFAAPPYLDQLEGPFDLVVNAYSLQEMNRTSVDEYYAHIARTLAPSGFFYSLNSHAKAGIRRPSEYPVHLFDVASFGPLRSAPFFVFATEPYELVLRTRTGEQDDATVARALDALGGLMQLGFRDELHDLCSAVPDAHHPPDPELVAALHTFVWDEDPARKLAAVDRLRLLASPVPCDYLEGTVRFARHEWDAAISLFDSGLRALAASHARTRGLLMKACSELALGDQAAAEQSTAGAVELAPHLAEELRSFASDPATTAATVAVQIGLPALPAASQPRGVVSRIRPRRRLSEDGGSVR
jgi:putative sugar O-methyltransferase